MEKILKKANELGHLLNANDVVKRMRQLSEKLDKDEEAKKLIEDLMAATQAFQLKESAGEPIEAEEKRNLTTLQEKAKENTLLSEYLATQAYYINILTQVNEAIANPQGEPPKESKIVLPGEDKGIIIT